MGSEGRGGGGGGDGRGEVSTIDYPKTVKENLIYRVQLLAKCQQEVQYAAAVREYVKSDILFCFNTFFWAYHPPTAHKDRPIVTYKYQDDTILEINHAIDVGENLFIDKSRDMLATYMVDLVFLYRWMTRTAEEFRLGSRTQDMVDKQGDMDTHFEKLRYNLKRLPQWMLPLYFNWAKHSTYMRLFNPENRSSLLGEATNANFGRGGRKKAILFDEFASWEQAESAWQSATDATPCKIALGTPQGLGNKFAQLARSSEVKRKIHLIWYKHPEKAYTSESHLERVKLGEVYDKVGNYTVEVSETQAPAGCYVDQHGKVRSEWYDKEQEKRSANDIAENIDCNYMTSGRPVFDLLMCDARLRESQVPLMRGDLVWVVPPKFNEEGSCTNKKLLRVKFILRPNGLWCLYRQKEPDKAFENAYCIGADIAEGLEQGDFDDARVYYRVGEKPVLVGVLHARLKTHVYAEELAKAGVYWGYCVVAPERTGMGLTVIEQLFRFYPRIYFKEIFSKGYASATDQLGWSTSQQSKQNIIGELNRQIAKNLFVCDDETFWKETLTFVNNDGKLEAQGKSQNEQTFDDAVMSTAITLWVSSSIPLPKRKDKPDENPYDWRKNQKKEMESRRLVGWVV